MIKGLGKITATTGIPVRCTFNETDPTKLYPVHGVLLQALFSNTGKVYVGSATMNKSTLAGVYAVLSIPTVSNFPTFSAALTLSPNAVTLDDLYIDVDVSGEGVLGCALIT